VNRDSSHVDQLFVSRTDGSHRRQITSNSSSNLLLAGPAFSPNGKQIVFEGEDITGGEGQSDDIYVIHADGSGQHPITTDGRPDDAAPEAIRHPHGEVPEGDPGDEPDQRRHYRLLPCFRLRRCCWRRRRSAFSRRGGVAGLPTGSASARSPASGAPSSRPSTAGASGSAAGGEGAAG